MPLLYLSLGSNLGDRQTLLRQALERLEERLGRMVDCSTFHETMPEDMASDRPFLNAAASFETNLPPETVLRITQEVERTLGRTSKSHNGIHTDRPIDLDLLQYGTHRSNTPTLRLPHPELARRRFVLSPLAEIAPHERYILPPYPTFITMLEHLDTFHIQCPTAANRSDWAAVNVLIDQLSAGKSISWEDYEALLATPSTRLGLLVSPEGQVVGMITLCTTFCPTGRKAWIEDVTVHSDYRGRGLSHQLLAWAKAEAATLHQQKVMLTSRPARVAANKLYQGEGFVQRETNVYRFDL